MWISLGSSCLEAIELLEFVHESLLSDGASFQPLFPALGAAHFLSSSFPCGDTDVRPFFLF